MNFSTPGVIFFHKQFEFWERKFFVIVSAGHLCVFLFSFFPFKCKFILFTFRLFYFLSILFLTFTQIIYSCISFRAHTALHARSTHAEINAISQHSTLLILTYCAHWIVRLLTVVFFFPFRTLCEELSEQILGVAIRQQRPAPRKSRYFYFIQITIITQIEL